MDWGKMTGVVTVEGWSPQAGNKNYAQSSLVVCLMENKCILSDRWAEFHRLDPDRVDEGQKEKDILNESQGITYPSAQISSLQLLPSSGFVAGSRKRVLFSEKTQN